jgi:hypothetical protein
MASNTIRYLDDLELYKHEKPYHAAIEPWNIPGANAHNLSCTAHEVRIQSMRPSLNQFSIHRQGFQSAAMSTSMSEKDFYHKTLVESTYYKECEAFFRGQFGAEEVRFFDYTVGVVLN